MQKKDIIYIDVEDDITAIIGKIKASKEKIIALVPPKRVGALQSAVNLRLLSRTADNADKRLVIITGNAALSGLAASAKIPVAKTLQSRPELAELPSTADMDDEDVIEGSDLSIGDHARMKDDDSSEDEMDINEASIDDLKIDGEPAPVRKAVPAKKSREFKKPNIKVPDFGLFRKKLALAIGGGVLLVVFLVWAIWFAPHATVVVSARTSDVEVQMPVTIGTESDLDVEKSTLPALMQTEKQEETVEFEATGKKDIGEKSTGTVVFENCESPAAITVSSGTYVSAGDKSYVVQSTVVVPGGTSAIPFGPCTNPGQSAAVKIVADDVGEDFNQSSGTNFDVAGRGSGFNARANSDISGGSKKTITVASDEDIQKALDKIKEDNTEEVKKKLLDKFDTDAVVIEESFTATPSKQELSPKQGEEVTGGTADLTVEMTYSLMGIPLDSLEEFLKTVVEEQLGSGSETKRIFNSGAKTPVFADFKLAKDKKKATMSLSATAKVGPKIEDTEIKEVVKGKKFGEVEGELKAIEGVSDVEVKLSPFWIIGVPDDVNKITIEFKLVEDE